VQSAADLAALAAAQQRSCAAGRSIAAANQAELMSCVLGSDDVEVTLGRDWLGHTLVAVSRAGS
jgi:hypothetical protein